jgi:hypothetical protein
MRALNHQTILDLDSFNNIRTQKHAQIIALKKIRRLSVGPDITFYFENYETLWWQIQEMLRIEQGGEDQIEDELRAYGPLIPRLFEDGSFELVATMMIEIPQEQRRKEVLETLGGIEKKISLCFDDVSIPAQSEEDVERTTSSGKTSAIHFLRFVIPKKYKISFLESDVCIKIDHRHYNFSGELTPLLKQSLLDDFV